MLTRWPVTRATAMPTRSVLAADCIASPAARKRRSMAPPELACLPASLQGVTPPAQQLRPKVSVGRLSQNCAIRHLIAVMFIMCHTLTNWYV